MKRIMPEESPRERILKRVQTIRVLPTADPVLIAALKVLSDPEASVRDICHVVRYDSALTSKILSIANSAFYSRGLEVVSVERAIVAIGYDEVRRIITSLVFINRVLGGFGVGKEHLLSLFRHSLYVAYATRVLSLRMLVDHPERLFVISLLHDIGKLVFFLCEDTYGELLEQSEREGVDVTVLERERFGTDHQEVGEYLSKRWKFPDVFGRVIGHHHERRPKDTFLEIVSVSDRFSLYPTCDLGDYGFVLLNAKEAIEREMRRTEALLGIGG